MIPAGRRVSVNNNAGAQLAARRVSYVFPYFATADWVVVDTRHPFIYDKENTRLHQQVLGRLVLDRNFQNVFAAGRRVRVQAHRAGSGGWTPARARAAGRSFATTWPHRARRGDADRPAVASGSTPPS